MNQFPIGVILDSFRTDLKTALDKAAAIGASGIQVYATQGEFSPENLSAAKRREFLDMCRSRGLTISALCGDLGQGFAHEDKNPALIEQSKRVLELAKDLETDVVTTHIGVVPQDSGSRTYAVMQKACAELAAFADSLDAHFAIETGPEPAAVLKAFLDTLDSTGVAVNLDPANLVMVTGDDPVAAVHTLQKYIVHTHAKDGRMLRRVNPVDIYDGTFDPAQGHPFLELPLGEGDVDFPAYLQALSAIGYTGFLTIEREVGENPEKDIRAAADFLRGLLR